jgi:hypothetical protein
MKNGVWFVKSKIINGMYFIQFDECIGEIRETRLNQPAPLTTKTSFRFSLVPCLHVSPMSCPTTQASPQLPLLKPHQDEGRTVYDSPSSGCLCDLSQLCYSAFLLVGVSLSCWHLFALRPDPAPSRTGFVMTKGTLVEHKEAFIFRISVLQP